MIVKRRVSNGYDWVVYHKDDVGGHYLNNTTTNNENNTQSLSTNQIAATDITSCDKETDR